jgi:hypothetical protein
MPNNYLVLDFMERSSRQIQHIIRLHLSSKNITTSNPDCKKEVLLAKENFLKKHYTRKKLSMLLRCQLMETVFTTVLDMFWG